MLLYTVSEAIALHDILVLLLSSNAAANNTLLHLTLPISSTPCWVNPLLITSETNARIPSTRKVMSTVLASQVKSTVELRVVLTDWGWTVISVVYKLT